MRPKGRKTRMLAGQRIRGITDTQGRVLSGRGDILGHHPVTSHEEDCYRCGPPPPPRKRPSAVPLKPQSISKQEVQATVPCFTGALVVSGCLPEGGLYVTSSGGTGPSSHVLQGKTQGISGFLESSGRGRGGSGGRGGRLRGSRSSHTLHSGPLIRSGWMMSRLHSLL